MAPYMARSQSQDNRLTEARMHDPQMNPTVAGPGPTSPWVARFLDLIRPEGEILDVACGNGRHLQLGLASGRSMVGVDRDVSAARLLPADGRLVLIEADLENSAPWPLGGRRFDGVIVTNYLWRPLLPAIVGAVGPAGLLIYETFGTGQERFGRPRNPDFLLRPSELIDAARPALVILAYENAVLSDPQRVVQRIAAVGRRHPLALAMALPD